MKICWDNLEKLEYISDKALWRTKNYIYYVYKENCKNCNRDFLTSKYKLAEFCSNSCARKNMKYSDEVKKQMSISTKDKFKNEKKYPNYGMKKKKHSRNTKKKISIAACKRIGEKAANWRGGISFDPYCSGWRQLTQELKKDNNECQNLLCEGKSERITSHHIDYNKQNCQPSNIITLCNSCNAKANSNRDWWQAFYTEIKRRLNGKIF